ncbi:hypothetical protein JOC86_003981 [Bacillus pakistanensis]|uniref:Uncharacterized protein n=1 Tax=Rossellomorea pakistanensis TaxID=992288 RepID=A0ABS2NHV9_9BACI|nr:hypothetical protein [Bacillus pakistanensis]MBM7587408.1 hypothetical protein [Bacillus pakistanensis]
MKATLRLPKTKLGWIFLSLIIVNVLLGSWPVIVLFNSDMLILGLPVIIFWSYVIVFTTTSIMWLASRMGVH